MARNPASRSRSSRPHYAVLIHPSGTYAMVTCWDAPRCTIGFELHTDGRIVKNGIAWFDGPPRPDQRQRTIAEAREALQRERATIPAPVRWPWTGPALACGAVER